MKTSVSHLMDKTRSLLLALDQGLEHGPTDFNLKSIDPEYLLDIAVKGRYNGMILQKGLAEKYWDGYQHKIPLVVKVNGKTNIPDIEPYSPITCSVKRAVELGADAIGFTVYLGSPMEPIIFQDFRRIQEEAHDFGLPVIAWMYPRGKFVRKDTAIDILAYAARAGLELGADMLKMKFNTDIPGYKWVVKSAGNVPLVCAGGSHLKDDQFLKRAHDIMQTGASGMAIGRNIWQHENPLKMTRAVKSIIFQNKTVEQAKKFL